jgi:cyclopropane-fatty-acyl-phospholipid synthase
MMYSCGIFPTPGSTLEEASLYKLDKICQKLDLKSGDKIVEIGTGWGGFAIHAAENYGCEIVTTTISQKLDKKITLLQQDYRKLEGKYDKLVSIEMIEAVGHQYFNTFFKRCGDLLKSDGQMLLQAITIQDQVYERVKNNVDFIKRYIFPGSCLPSVTASVNAITASSDMRVFHLEDIGWHYAKTLASWRDNFLSNKSKVLGLGFDENTIRLWEYYFSYCEAGFAEGYISDIQMLCLKPDALRAK